MEYRYFSYPELKKFFLTEKIEKDLTDYSSLGIGSVADLYFVNEEVKKNIIDLSLADLLSKFQILEEKYQSNIFFPDLGKEQLLENLFDDYDGRISLWHKASDGTISPRFSISLLSIRANELSCYWSDEVFQKMEEYFLNLEKYG